MKEKPIKQLLMQITCAFTSPTSGKPIISTSFTKIYCKQKSARRRKVPKTRTTPIASKVKHLT